MRLRHALALAVLTAGLAVLLGDFTTAADTPPAKQDLKAKRKAAAIEARLKARAAAEAEAAKPAAKPAEPTPAPVVAGPAKDPTPLARLIDAQITQKLATANLSPSPVCSDEEFLRRACL